MSELTKYIFLFILLLAAGGTVWYVSNLKNEKIEYACTQEAKICPDGTAVGRTGPNCEFAECPASAKNPFQNIDNDNDGTWDNIQIFIEQNYSSDTNLKSAALQLAHGLQNALLSASDPEKSYNAAVELQRASECLYGLNADEANSIRKEIESAFLHSNERARAFVEFNEQLGGKIFPSKPLSELLTSCTTNTSNWQTYRNEEYGFEVKYPLEWKILNEGETSYGNTSGFNVQFGISQVRVATEIEIFEAQLDESIAKAFQRITTIDPNALVKNNIMVAGVSGEYYKDVPGHFPYDEVMLIYKTRFYGLIRYFAEDKTFVSFASTFKFIESKVDTDVILWDRIVLPESGISVGVPPDHVARLGADSVAIREPNQYEGSVFSASVIHLPTKYATLSQKEALEQIAENAYGVSPFFSIVGFHDGGLEITADTLEHRHFFVYDPKNAVALNITGDIDSSLFYKIVQSIDWGP